MLEQPARIRLCIFNPLRSSLLVKELTIGAGEVSVMNCGGKQESEADICCRNNQLGDRDPDPVLREFDEPYAPPMLRGDADGNQVR